MKNKVIEIIIERHVNIKQDGKQIYAEPLKDTDELEPHISDCQNRLRQLRDALPSSKWSATIETLLKCNGKLRRQNLDIEYGDASDVLEQER